MERANNTAQNKSYSQETKNKKNLKTFQIPSVLRQMKYRANS